MIIDRFEGEYAVCEQQDGTFIHIERSQIADAAKEGDVLVRTGDCYRVDAEATAARRAHIRNLFDGLFSR